MFHFSAVFTWTNLLVVVAELDGNENEALDLVPLVTNVVLEVRQQLVEISCLINLFIYLGTSISCWHCSHSRSWNCSNKFSVKKWFCKLQEKLTVFLFQGRKTENASERWIFSRSVRPHLCCL